MTKPPHPVIGIVSTDEPPPEPVEQPEPPSEPLKWCSECDCLQDAHAPECPTLRRSAPPPVVPPPAKLPTWGQAAAKVLRRLARRLEDG